jgi:DNA helicase II / ATP-dependent DNA helicase PcrA
MQNLLAGLNPEQLAAVTLPRESALVLAGAGSGKTRVLTTRLAYLVQSGQISPHGVLAVTFTNKAAREMLTRLTAMLPINTRGMWIGTFHGLCNRLLRTHFRDAGLPQVFQILDSQDQLAAIKRLLKAANADEDKYPPRSLQYFINDNKEEGKRADKVAASNEIERKFIEFYAAYDEQCQREGVVDFGELLLRSFELLNRNEVLRAHYQERFKFILVDEFQDTNRLQYQWLKLLAGTDNAVFAVGDDDQSIYAFRGANVGNMRDFQHDFVVKHLLKLTQNYRSHGNILDAANAIIRHNRSRLGKDLWTEAGQGEPIRVFEAQTDLDEARFVVEEVKALRSGGMALSDMALLYRSNAQSRVLEHALFTAGLPYRVYGGVRFFERQEIKHALAYLRLAANADDDGAFLRVVNFPARGIGARSIELMEAAAKERSLSLLRAGEAGVLGARAQSSLESFIKIVQELQTAAQSLPLPELMEHAIDHSGLRRYYQNEKDGADRVENLNELVNAAVAFVNESEDETLTAFLSHASLEAGEHEAAAGADALQVMTVHSAKGLEFHAVFVSGLEEGLFPHENSLSEQDGLEEERRLMYVAVTRARQRLYLSLAGSRMLHGQMRYGLRSRFIEEIPTQLCKWIAREPAAVAPSARASYANAPYPTRGWGQRPLTSTPRETARVHAPVPAAKLAEFPFRIGQSVVHAKFGHGVVVRYEGIGANAQVHINFERGGLKRLMLEYAKLTPA